jgi:hypothetical protein
LVESPETETNYVLAPNPTASLLSLQFDNDQAIQVEVLSASGQTIQKHADMQAYDSFNVSDLPAGIYFVRVTNAAGKTQMLRFTKI